MFQDMLASNSGSWGGGTLTVDTVKFTGTVSSSRAYTFEKDFKYVILVDTTNSNNPTWYQNSFTINGTVVTDIDGGNTSGSMGSASYTIWAAIPNIKSGDELKNTAGGFNFLMIGMN